MPTTFTAIIAIQSACLSVCLSICPLTGVCLGVHCWSPSPLSSPFTVSRSPSFSSSSSVGQSSVSRRSGSGSSVHRNSSGPVAIKHLDLARFSSSIGSSSRLPGVHSFIYSFIQFVHSIGLPAAGRPAICTASMHCSPIATCASERSFARHTDRQTDRDTSRQLAILICVHRLLLLLRHYY